MIENQFVFWYLAIMYFFAIIACAIRIFAPNYFTKRYMSGKSKMPSDNLTRFFGLIFLLTSIYVFAWVLGYVK